MNNTAESVMMKRRRIPNGRKEGIIDFTDFGNRNKASVTRETRSRLDPKSEHIGAFDSSAVHVIPEDKGLATYFPASGTTVTKRSQTVEERAEERMFDIYYYNDR